MAARFLKSADFDIAFDFSRSEAAQYRNARGEIATAAVDQPRFDHSASGAARGLLVTAGAELGGGDRVTIDPQILPIFVLGTPGDPHPAVTVLHHFNPGSGEQRRAWYSHDVVATVDALLRQCGHHLALGVVLGFLPNEAARYANGSGKVGFVRYRGQDWRLPALIAAPGGALEDGTGKPLIQGAK